MVSSVMLVAFHWRSSENSLKRDVRSSLSTGVVCFGFVFICDIVTCLSVSVWKRQQEEFVSERTNIRLRSFCDTEARDLDLSCSSLFFFFLEDSYLSCCLNVACTSACLKSPFSA